jgi:two-component system, sensor histidine kinase ChiS
MLTAKTQVADLVEGFNAGANDYVAKPFSKRELLSRIRTHLQLSKLTVAAGKFVPYEFLSYLNKESLVEVKLGDQVQKDMSVMFSDIRSYTTLSETMTPEENFQFLNRYFGELAPLIKAHHGFIDKFIGDAIMALFERSPLDAVAASVAMQHKLREFNAERIATGKLPVAAGVGINTGSLMLGAIGHERRMQSTVISDAVNIAARLETLTKVFKASIIISAETFRRCADDRTFTGRCLGRVRVKGKTQPVAIYEVIDGYAPDVVKLKLATRAEFEKGVEAWQRQDVPECDRLMRLVLDQNKLDQAALLYRNRCQIALGGGVVMDSAIEPDVALLV